MQNLRSILASFFLMPLFFLFTAQHLSASPQKEIRLEHVRLLLKWNHQFQFAGYYAAVEKGFYRNEGLDVQFIEGKSGQDLSADLASGKADFCVNSSGVLLDRERGLPIVIIAPIFQHSPEALIVREKSGIRTPHELVGHIISLPTRINPAIESMLIGENVSREKINIVHESDPVSAFVQGRIDGFGGYITNEPNILASRGIAVTIIKPLNYGIDFYGDCMVTTESMISRHPKTVHSFYRASLKGWDYAMHHPDEMISLIKTKYQSSRSEAELMQEYQAIHTLIMSDLIEIGHMNFNRWHRIKETYISLGLLPDNFRLGNALYTPYNAIPLITRAAPVLAVLASILAIGILISGYLYLKNRSLRRSVENRIRENESRYKSLIQNLPQKILMKDQNLFYVSANPSYAADFDLKPEEMLGKTDYDLFPPELAEKYRSDDRAVMSSRATFDMEETYIKKGHSYTVHTVKTPVYDEKGDVIGILVIFWNITERKRIEEELQLYRTHLEELVSTRTRQLRESDNVFATLISSINDHDGTIRGITGLTRDITALKKTEQLLHKERNLVQKYLDVAGVILVEINHQHEIIMINRKGCRILEYTEGELIGKNWFDLCLPAEARGKVKSEFDNILSGRVNTISRLENPIITKSGKQRIISWRNTIIKNDNGDVECILSSGEDVTESRWLMEERHLFFEVSLDMICIATTDGYFRQLSPMWSKTLGWSDQELMERPYIEFVHPDDVQSTIDAAGQLSTGNNVINFDNRYLCKDGSYRWLSWKSYVDNGHQRVYAIARDINEQKKNEEQLRKAINISEAASQAKSEFLVNMSHEIRTPLNAITGFTYLALKADSAKKQKEHIERIHSSTRNLTGIIDSILDFSKIESGKLELSTIEVSLRQILENVITMVSMMADKKGVRIETHFMPTIPVHLRGDPLRIEQVLINLVGNAVKFTEQGSVILSAGLVRDNINGSDIRIQIEDTGIGMTEEQIARLFQPFLQADHSITRRYGGPGLGLAIAKRLINAMGSDISIRSTPGKGSVFTFTLHLEKDPTIMRQSSETRDTGYPNRVLIADHDPDSLKILPEILSGMGFETEIADNNDDIIPRLDDALTAGKPFNLLVLGHDHDYTDVLVDIKTRPGIADTCRIVLTADQSDTTDHERAECAHIDAVLVKPLSWSKLLDAIMNIFRLAAYKSETVIPEQISKPRSWRFTSTNILLVEDNAINQLVARSILEQTGITVTVAENGQQAIDIFRNKPGSFDLILMDIQMPLMDGYESTQRLREIDAQIPIIAMTAHAFREDMEKTIEVGMNDYISKPITPEILFDKIATWIAHPDLADSDEKTYARHDLPLTIPGINIEKYQSVHYENERLIIDTLSLFLTQFSLFREEFTDILGQNDFKKAERMIHTLKGTSGTIFAEELHNQTIKVEKILVSQKSLSADNHELLRLFELLQQLLSSISGISPSSKVMDSINSDNIDAEQAAQLVKELDNHLERHNIRAYELFERVRPALAQSGQSNEIEAIAESIKNLDYGYARSLLKRFL